MTLHPGTSQFSPMFLCPVVEDGNAALKGIDLKGFVIDWGWDTTGLWKRLNWRYGSTHPGRQDISCVQSRFCFLRQSVMLQ